MSTKAANILDLHSCWNRAHDDEPVFVLRANDDMAPQLVLQWATLYMIRKGGCFSNMTPEQQRKYRDAIDVAEAMRAWFDQQRGFDKDIPF